MAMAADEGQLEALETQSSHILDVFTKAGYARISPEVMQPADIFLDVVGEDIRARTYVFTDLDGEEQCLRPDLTVPTCRAYLARHPKAEIRARYCYDGLAFRYQRDRGEARQPREFRQIGIENFGAPDREKAEAELVALAVDAVRAAGLSNCRLKFGDLGLLNALLSIIDVPQRWRDQLIHAFHRPDVFRARLAMLSEAPGRQSQNLPEELVNRLDPNDLDGSESGVADYMAAHEIELIGTRTLGEITAHLLAIMADARAEPMDKALVDLIESYVAIQAPPRAAGARIADLMSERGVDLSAPLEVYRRRLDLLTQAGVEVSSGLFDAEFGRNLDYYTGFVFQIEGPGEGKSRELVGGGRYDNLLHDIGAPNLVPGVGFAIHAERLLAAVPGDQP